VNATALIMSTRISGGSIVWSVLLIILGLLAIGLPLATSFGAVLIIGWIVIFSGITQILHAFQSKGIGGILWKILVAFLYLGFGIYLLRHPILGLATLTLVIAIFLFAEGVMNLAAFFTIAKSERSGWVILDGVVTLTLGLMIWRHWPASSTWVIGTVVGISLVMTGFTRLMITLAARRVVAAHAV
jgi:uncharacterized membrane protein HdeD (DUF308 family)